MTHLSRLHRLFKHVVRKYASSKLLKSKRMDEVELDKVVAECNAWSINQNNSVKLPSSPFHDISSDSLRCLLFIVIGAHCHECW